MIAPNSRARKEEKKSWEVKEEFEVKKRGMLTTEDWRDSYSQQDIAMWSGEGIAQKRFYLFISHTQVKYNTIHYVDPYKLEASWVTYNSCRAWTVFPRLNKFQI